MHPSLAQMIESMTQGNPVYHPSKFWQTLSASNLNHLRNGLGDFKQTVATNYFTWVEGKDYHAHFLSLTKELPVRIWPGLFKGLTWRGGKHLNRRRTLKLTLFTKMLWRYAQQLDPQKILARLQEPVLGEPFPIYLDGKLISQDLANSVLEYYSATDGPASEVCELGAGYGRTAYVFLSVGDHNYTIIDIPPALYLAQSYLSAVFPEKKVFTFREFSDYEEVREEFEASQIRFLLPHQAELLPAKIFDLFINISSLHEMMPEQIEAYFYLIDHLTRGRFYSKQWLVGRNHIDQVWIRAEDYPIPGWWKEIYLRPAKVQTNFFEALYEVGQTEGGVIWDNIYAESQTVVSS